MTSRATQTVVKMASILLMLMLALPLCRLSAQNKKSDFTLVIDPGHGGKDPGAVGQRRNKEKTINLNVSKQVGKMIKERYPEVNIIYTRSTDIFVPLMQRANIANKANANLFISIHTNAARNRNARGCETFTLGAGSSAEAKAAAKYENEAIKHEDNFEQKYQGFDPNSDDNAIIFDIIRTHDMEKSISLAESIQRGMVTRSKLQNKGVFSGNFLVLHQTAMPSVLVELGFISNAKEEQYLISTKGQEALARGIFDGFAKYYEEYKKNVNTNNGHPTNTRKTKEAAPTPTTPTPKAKKEETSTESDQPIFKVQILTASTKLKSNDKRLKGIKADYYYENKTYKYTVGATSDYEAIKKKRKELSKSFKQAFIVAFKGGKRIDTQIAIEEYNKNKKR